LRNRYAELNKQRIKELTNRYYRSHKERIKELRGVYYRNHKEEFKNYPSQTIEKRREYSHKYYLKRKNKNAIK
jgi:hypothetical protein